MRRFILPSWVGDSCAVGEEEKNLGQIQKKLRRFLKNVGDFPKNVGDFFEGSSRVAFCSS